MSLLTLLINTLIYVEQNKTDKIAYNRSFLCLKIIIQGINQFYVKTINNSHDGIKQYSCRQKLAMTILAFKIRVV